MTVYVYDRETFERLQTIKEVNIIRSHVDGYTISNNDCEMFADREEVKLIIYTD